MNFKEYLKEYYSTPIQPGDLTPKKLSNHLTQTKQINSFSILNDSFLINEVNFGNTALFILQNKNEIIGYTNLCKFRQTDFWQVQTVEIFSIHFRGKGLGKLFYKSIIGAGYSLVNGLSLSKEAEGMGKSLIKSMNGKTYDALENKVLPLDERPSHDTTRPYDGEQRYFWLLQK